MARPDAADQSPVSGVAGRYAQALLELAEGAGTVDAVGADLDRFDALVAASPDLARLVRSPAFSAEAQTRALGAVLDHAGISGLAGRFLRVVAANRRLFAVRDIARAYRDLVARSRGVVRAQVTVAEPLNPGLEAEVKAALATLAPGKVEVDLRVDPAILGGMVVRLGSRMIDASLRTKLNALRTAMKSGRSPSGQALKEAR